MAATNPAARAVPARFDRSTQHRRAMLAKINIARHQLGMVEDDYRQLLHATTGQISLKTCDDRQLAQMIAALKSKGFQALPKGQPGGKKGVAQHPVALKARALWISLYQLGVVHNPDEAALEAFAKRQTKCEKMVWMNQSQGFALIEALKSMAVKGGWLQHCPATRKALTPAVLQISLCQVILAKLQQLGGVPERWLLNDAAVDLLGIDRDGHAPFTTELYVRLADALGQKLREIVPAGVVQ